MISRVKHMNKLHESKCLNVKSWQETTGFFSCGVNVLANTLIHVVTLTKSLITSQVTKTRVLTKSLRSSSRRGGAQDTYNLLLRAPTILGKLREKHLDHQDRLGDANHQE